MKRIHTQIEIDAPADKVWAILTDFNRYSEWNPFILEASGQVGPEQKLRVTIKPPDEKAMTFKPKVVAAEPGKRLCWLGRLGIPGLFDGHHCFEVEEVDPGRCRFSQSETFTGILPALFSGKLAKTKLGFEFMNEALKRRAENPAA